MNSHPMRYVGMIDQLLKPQYMVFTTERARLLKARKRLIDAAIEEAAAYGEFKDILKELDAKGGHPLTAGMIKKTYTDLT